AGAFKSLVLCAPPRPLGLLRENLSAPARERLSQVLAKDYLHASAEELEQRLRAE
ncbi:MAG TPA: host attachment protein, partial [Hyphomonadaceae bacterium]|nr:host attachment protein [Hyphomonadaceae bacterium]